MPVDFASTRPFLACCCLVTTLVGLTGCDVLFTFDRELPVSRGAIFGEGVRDEAGGEKAAYSQINLMGVGLVRQAASDGSFALTDLGAGTYILRINDDSDGDGLPNRSRLVATSLVVADKPDAFGFGSGQQLVSTTLGEVVIEGTGVVEGRVTIDDGTGVQVPPAAANLGARVLLFRDVVTELTGDQALQLGADAETHVDAGGNYRFTNALTGEFLLVVTLHENPGAIRGDTVFVSSPQRLTLELGETLTAAPVEVDEIDIDLEDSTRPVEVVVAPPLSDRGAPYAIFAPPGRAMSTCQSTRPDSGQFVYERIVDATAASIARLENAPLGVWDVRLCGQAFFIDAETGNLEDEVELGGATVFSLVIPPSEDGVSTVLTGPVVLTRELDPCVRRICANGSLDCPDGDKVFLRDCDGDGIAGITPFDASDQEVVATWEACAEQCGANTGLGAVEAECTFDAVVYDCDDDGDLQTDASEPPACYGPGLGDDRDGDGICSGEDGFPTCAANTAADCDAGTIDVTPVTPPEFEGGEVVTDPFDLTFGNSGVISVVPTSSEEEFNLLHPYAADENNFMIFSEKSTRDAAITPAATQYVNFVDANTATAISSAPIFNEAAGAGVVFFANQSDSIDDGDGITHYFAGTGTTVPDGYAARNPHICRGESASGSEFAADTNFAFSGCSNEIAATAPSTLQEFRAVAVVNGSDACAAGEADGETLFVQCYEQNETDGSNLGTSGAFSLSTFASAQGYQSVTLTDVVAMTRVGLSSVVLFIEVNGNLPGNGPPIPLSLYGVFDYSDGVITADLTAIDLAGALGEEAALVVDVIDMPDASGVVKIMGNLLTGNLSDPATDLFIMDFSTVDPIGPIVSSALSSGTPDRTVKNFRSIAAIDGQNFIVSGGVDLRAGLTAVDYQFPVAARWLVSVNDTGDALNVVEQQLGEVALGLDGYFSEAEATFVIADRQHLVGLRAEDLGVDVNEEPLFGDLELWVGRLSATSAVP